jgi:hypothetical protein
MYLKKFPMDSQACPIEIGSLGYFTRDMIYVWKDVEIDEKMGNMLSQYKLLSIVKSSYNLTDQRDRNQCPSARLKGYADFHRDDLLATNCHQ